MSAITRHARHGRWAQRVALASVALACGTAWGRPAFDDVALRRLLVAHGFSAAQAQTALATLERAEGRGLPASALESRLREGLARHASPAAIERVLDRRLGELTRADDVTRLGSGQGLVVRDRQGSLSRLADSFALGVAPADVSSLLPAAARAKRDFDSVSRAAEVMGRLARQGSPAADTRDVVAAALAAGWARDEMDGLVDVFATARRLGVTRGQVRQTLVDGIRNGKGPDRLSAGLKAEAKAAGPGVPAGRSSSSTADSARSGASHSGRPKAGKGAGSPHSAGPPSHGVRPHTPAPRPHAPRGPAHGAPHR